MPSADSIPAEPTKFEKQSASPAPEPPTAQTPGRRATAFLDLYQKTLSTSLRTISYDNFAACFPTMAVNAPENLRGLHKAMIERLEGFAQVCLESYIIQHRTRHTSHTLPNLAIHLPIFSNLPIQYPVTGNTDEKPLSQTISQARS